jgi:tetratricopeptide (TPR) repeat protein/DNA-binding XRE family transcriptional regulator
MSAVEHRGAQGSAAGFGTWVRAQRTTLLLTQEELAERAGVSVRTIQSLEAGRRGMPRLDTQRLITAVLAEGNGTPVPLAGPRAVSAAENRPAQLFADMPDFMGRGNELRWLDGLLATVDDGQNGVVIGAVTGPGGVGKTALAMHWAHQACGRFVDGQLCADLHGYDLEQPAATAGVLAAFLEALGIPGADVPDSLAARAARYRSLMAGRKMLVVLDNAVSPEQVRHLLPGSPSCLVLVTSRDRLAGLVIRHGARRLELGTLPMADSVRLLHTLIGDRAAGAQDDLRRLAELCDRLPLALRTIADLAWTSPQRPLATLVRELADERHRLDLLSAGGDQRTSLRAVLSWSYRNLPADVAHAFRLIGMHPGHNVDAYEIAALADAGLPEARRLLDILAEVHLVQQTAPGRYGMHELLRICAREQAGTLPAPGRAAALHRLLDYYRAGAWASARFYAPDGDLGFEVDVSRGVLPPLADRDGAAAWLAAERTNIIAAVRATSGVLPAHAVQLGVLLWPYLDAGAFHADARGLYLQALDAARRIGDRRGEARILGALGVLDWRQGHNKEASRHFRDALRLFHDLGELGSEAGMLSNLGIVAWQTGHIERSIAYHRRAFSIYQQISDRAGQGRVLGNLSSSYIRRDLSKAQNAIEHALVLFRGNGDHLREGVALGNLAQISMRSGRLRQAAELGRRALELHRLVGNRGGEVEATNDLGNMYQRLGDHRLALDHHRRALALAREIADTYGEAAALEGLAVLFQDRGDHAAAVEHHRQALLIAGRSGDRSHQAAILNGLGETLQASGQLDQAGSHHQSALGHAREAADRYEQARAHRGLARVSCAAGDMQHAESHRREASILYAGLGVPQGA